MDRQARVTRIAASVALAQLAGCAAPIGDYAGLRIEQRPAEGIIRISNSGTRAAILHYNVAPGFGNYHMFFVRFRDGSSRVIGDDEYTHGWWTPLTLTSQLYAVGERADRQRLTVPAGGRIEMPRDIAALTLGRRVTDIAPGPCEVQIMLVGYRGMRVGQRRIEVLSEWQPAPCPEVNARRSQ